MFAEQAQVWYMLHYKEVISPCFTDEEKKDIAQRISDLTLKSPIWTDRKTNFLPQVPELSALVNVELSGLYLCAIMKAIVEELQIKLSI